MIKSTLAAKKQTLNRGLSELSYKVTVHNELTIKSWIRTALRKQRLNALVSKSNKRALAKNLSIVNAKSIFLIIYYEK